MTDYFEKPCFKTENILELLHLWTQEVVEYPGFKRNEKDTSHISMSIRSFQNLSKESCENTTSSIICGDEHTETKNMFLLIK